MRHPTMKTMNEEIRPWRADAGVRAIVVYKTVKGAAALVLGAALLVLDATHEASFVHAFAGWVRHHATAGWSVALADAILRESTPRGIALTGTALLLDGALTSVEGWALRRGHAWGAWLVVIATGALVPFEIFEIARHVKIGRVLVFVANVAIVVYLVRRARRERRDATTRTSRAP